MGIAAGYGSLAPKSPILSLRESGFSDRKSKELGCVSVVVVVAASNTNSVGDR